MKKLLLLLAFPLVAFAQWTPPPALTTWTESTVIGFNADNSKLPTIIFNSTLYPVGTCPGYDGTPLAFAPCNFASDTWTQIPLAQFGVPATAKEVFLQGLLVLTPGTNPGTENLWAQCRAPGSNFPDGWKQMQAIDQTTGSVLIGVRSTTSMWCPVANGKIEFLWHHDFNGTVSEPAWPVGHATLINLTLQAYTR